jgi:hypothetical protein
VNLNVIRSNAKHGTNEPVITIKRGKRNTYCHNVEILGPSKVVYRPCKPLSCGAKVWIETDSALVIDGAIDMNVSSKRGTRHPYTARATDPSRPQ